jgi:hypothetical protein
MIDKECAVGKGIHQRSEAAIRMKDIHIFRMGWRAAVVGLKAAAKAEEAEKSDQAGPVLGHASKNRVKEVEIKDFGGIAE